MSAETGSMDVFDGIEIHSDTVSLESFKEASVVEEYSVSQNASITVLESESGDYLYKVNEPKLDEFEKLIRAEVSKKIVDALKYEDARSYSNKEMENIVRTNATALINNYISPSSNIIETLKSKLPWTASESEVDKKSREKVLYYIVRDFVYYGKITPILEDEHIEDISCDAPNMPVFVYHEEYRDMMTNVAYEESELDSFIRTLSQEVGKHISIADPMIEGSLEDGSRVQLTLSDEVTGDGSNFTIRRFQDIPFTPVDLIDYSTFSKEQMAYLWLCIENNKSLIFAGGTASGKTTSMNAVSLFIPPGSKTITIEDTREIKLRHNNWIKSMTRDSFGGDDQGEVDMYDLLVAALRQRPEYLIVGEIRGEEARTLFQAMSTGHTTYSTMHADSIDSSIHRLENPPIEVPRQMIGALDILCVQNQTFVGGERVRRNESIVEITGIDNRTQKINTQTVFNWDSQRDIQQQTGQSSSLQNIAQQRAWDSDEIESQLEERERLLEYMLEHDIRKYEVVTDIIRSYIVNSDFVMEKLESNEILKIASDEDTEELFESARSEADTEPEDEEVWTEFEDIEGEATQPKTGSS